MADRSYNLTEHLEYSAKFIGGGSFMAGTVLFILQIIFPTGGYEVIGLYFVGYAFLLNALLFVGLVVASTAFYRRSTALLKTAGLLLLNIPVAVLYFMIILNQNPF